MAEWQQALTILALIFVPSGTFTYAYWRMMMHDDKDDDRGDTQ